MLNYKTRYPNNTPDLGVLYPYGQARADTFEGAKDGFPFHPDWINDILGVLQFIVVQGRIEPNGYPDSAGSSQVAQALFATYRPEGYKALNPSTPVGSTYNAKGWSELTHYQIFNTDPPEVGAYQRKSSALRDGGVVFGGNKNVGFRREMYDFTGDLIWNVGTQEIAGVTRQVYSYDAGTSPTPIVFEGIPLDANIHGVSFVMLLESPPGTPIRSLTIPLSYSLDFYSGEWPILDSAFAIAADYGGGSTEAVFYVDWDPS